MSWIKTGNNNNMCVYWTNRSKSESQISIMNTNEFYSRYPELDKHNTKKRDFELSVTPQYSSSNYKNVIGYYTTFEEAFNIALQIMLDNPDCIPFNYVYQSTKYVQCPTCNITHTFFIRPDFIPTHNITYICENCFNKYVVELI